MWPTRSDIDLLHAALDEDPRSAQAAWDRWRLETGGIPDPAALRLLPLVEWNLRRATPGALEAPGFVEKAAISGLSFAEAAAPVVRSLGETGASVLVLKGLALAHSFYPHPGLRPMSDVDLLVPPSGLAQARAGLEALGWRIAEPEPDARLRHLHGAAYRKPGASEIDLHTRALAESASPEADAGFFERAVALDIAGTPARTLAPGDHLLVVCVHGLRWSAAPAVHWVADAVMILREAETIDWEALIREAEARRLELSLYRALGLLAEEFSAPIPGAVLERLASADSPGRRREVAVRMTRPTLAGGLLLHWRQFSQERSDLSLAGRLRRFPIHMKEMWDLGHAWEVPAAAIRKSVARLARRR